MLGRTFQYGSTDSDRDDWCYFWDHIDGRSMVNGREYYDVDMHWPFDRPFDGYGSGPFRWWRSAHENCWRRDVVYHADNAWLRRCGYVLWDLPQTTPDLELRERVLKARQKALLDHFWRNDGDLRRRAKQSRKERIAIYKLGGRGYWREGDLSQVVWTEGSPGTEVTSPGRSHGDVSGRLPPPN
jgi:hypothetical protein